MLKLNYKRSSYGSYLSPQKTGFLDMLTKGRKHIFGLAGRTLLLDLFSILDVKQDGKILIPEFYPQGLKLPIYRFGIKPVFYKLNDDFSPSIESIQGLIEAHTIRMCILIHYFGKKIDFKQVCTLLNIAGILVIEDCAQSLFIYTSEDYPNKSILLYSFPKYLSLPAGAMAVFNIPVESERLKSVKYSRIYNTLGRLSTGFHTLSLKFRKLQSDSNWLTSYVFLKIMASLLYTLYYLLLCQIKGPVPLSKTLICILQHFDYKPFLLRRELLYKAAVSQMNLQELKPDIIRNVNPLGVPVKISGGQRDSIIHYLKKYNIELLYYRNGWYNGLDNNFSKIRNSFLIIPVNEHLRDSDIIDFLKLFNHFIKENQINVYFL